MIEINKVINGDCLEVMKTMEDNSVDSIVTDPPYEFYSFAYINFTLLSIMKVVI